MWKSLAPVLIHRVLLLALAFVAAKFAFAHDVAEKLMKGDTIQLWAGAPNISISEIENYLLIVAVPAAASFLLAGWSRVKAQFALITSRLSAKKLTDGQVKEIVAETPTSEIIKTVSEKP